MSKNQIAWTGELKALAMFDRDLTPVEIRRVHITPYIDALRALGPTVLMYHLKTRSEQIERLLEYAKH